MSGRAEALWQLQLVPSLQRAPSPQPVPSPQRCRRARCRRCSCSFRIDKRSRSFKGSRAVRFCISNVLDLDWDWGSIRVSCQIIAEVRWRSYNAHVRGTFTRGPHLFRVIFTNVNWLAPAVLPQCYHRGSVVAVQPVMRR